ncbi:hypothetical protein AQJ11_02895 [Streptomyces corchorusii]|uniref:HTH merR-type domain-containing protein n=2 Tax=Streptomyces TaxID=1883 RepID=A0A117QJX9_STRCK|nr:helix-turn-helix domain-containing protein [Streptomyces corchorusii]KUN32489.1 hypothetical protein AQJ11_02895 [Streptomyces corchorusii]
MCEPDVRELSKGQVAVIAVAAVPMVVAGVVGAWSTYGNIVSVFHRSTAALGVVGFGEGGTLVLAVVMVALTMLGQATPALVRVGVWVVPAVASATGAYVARNASESAIFAVTPLTMTFAAEGLALIARRVVIYRTRVDADAQRRAARRAMRDAATLHRISWHGSRARHLKSDRAKWWHQAAVWRLERRIRPTTATAASELIAVHDERVVRGAAGVLDAMYGDTPAPAPELPAASQPRDETLAIEQAPVQERPALDVHSDDALSLFEPAVPGALPAATPAPAPRATQPAASVQQDITPELATAVDDALRVVATDDSMRLLTAAEVAKQKGVTPGTVRSWVHRNKLKPARRDDDGRLHFHPADVAELD